MNWEFIRRNWKVFLVGLILSGIWGLSPLFRQAPVQLDSLAQLKQLQPGETAVVFPEAIEGYRNFTLVDKAGSYKSFVFGRRKNETMSAYLLVDGSDSCWVQSRGKQDPGFKPQNLTIKAIPYNGVARGEIIKSRI